MSLTFNKHYGGDSNTIKMDHIWRNWRLNPDSSVTMSWSRFRGILSCQGSGKWQEAFSSLRGELSTHSPLSA